MSFKTNENVSNQLSERIINSAEDVFQELFSNDFIQKFLMKGEITDKNITIAHRQYRDILYFCSDSFFGQLFKDLKSLTNDPDEKQFFGQCYSGLNLALDDYTKKFEKLFGKPELVVDECEINQAQYSYKFVTLNISSRGPLLRGLIPLLSQFMVLPRIMEYLQNNPNYLDNDLAKMMCMEDFNLNIAVQRIRKMFDCRGDQVSEDEEVFLKKLFKRCVNYDRLLEESNFKCGQWFEW